MFLSSLVFLIPIYIYIYVYEFLSYHENHLLDSCPSELKPVVYRRSVHEIEQDKSLPFLGVHVKKTGNPFVTDLYRKPIFTGLGEKHNNSIDHRYKTNLANCFIDRAYKLNFTYLSFLNSFINEVEKIKIYY